MLQDSVFNLVPKCQFRPKLPLCRFEELLLGMQCNEAHILTLVEAFSFLIKVVWRPSSSRLYSYLIIVILSNWFLIWMHPDVLRGFCTLLISIFLGFLGQHVLMSFLQ